MLRILRKHQKLILLVLGVSLAVIWSSTEIISRLVSEPLESAGEIFGRKVSLGELQNNAYRWGAWRGPREAQREIVWERLILLDEAQRAGLEVSDEELRWDIEAVVTQGRPEIPFDETTYQSFLNSRNLRAEDFEQTIREARLIAKLRRTITDAAIVTESQVLQRFKKENEKVKAKYVFLPAQDFLDEAKEPEEAEILKFYQANAEERYHEPEKVRVEYVAALFDHLAAKVEVSQEEINAYYAEHKEDFKVIEEPLEEKEQQDEASSSESPSVESESEVLEGESDEPPTSSDEPLTSSDESPTAQTRYKPLEELAGEIEAVLRERKARNLATETIIKATTDLDIAQTPDFEATAKKHGLSYISPDFFARDEAANLPYIGNSVDYENKSFAEVAFEMLGRYKEGADEISPIMSGSEGKFIFHITDQSPPRTQALDEVRPEIIQELKSKDALEVAKTRADSLWQKMGEASFEEVAGAEGLEIKETDFVTRWGALSALPFVEPAFDMEIGQIAAPSPYQDKVYLVKVEAREEADPAEFDTQKEWLRLLVSWEEKGRLYQEWLDHLRSRANFVDFQAEKAKKQREEPAGT
ncbi:MAG: hypothetical protein AMS15_01810 [Planctomycetes bacterium DG_23]|nr:MAG: hypothetical protein AMS15_01810 [Planctomycetes bacterium DG_23]